MALRVLSSFSFSFPNELVGEGAKKCPLPSTRSFFVLHKSQWPIANILHLPWVGCGCSVICAKPHWGLYVTLVVAIRTTYWSQVFPSTMWLELRLSGLAAGALTHRSISGPLLTSHWLKQARQIHLTHLVQKSNNIKEAQWNRPIGKDSILNSVILCRTDRHLNALIACPFRSLVFRFKVCLNHLTFC